MRKINQKKVVCLQRKINKRKIMKFIVSRDVLFKNLSAILGVITTNSSMEILSNFLFTIEGNILKLTSSDLETTMTAEIELTSVDGESSFAVPARTIIETLKLISEMPLVFEYIEENNLLSFTAASGEYNLICQPGDLFPERQQIVNSSMVEIDALILQRAISKTIFATGNDELRPNMMGVLCQLSSDGITFVATDAHKLVRYKNTKVQSDDFVSFILPKKPLIQLKNILVGINENVKFEYSMESNHLMFTFDNITLFSSLREGKFPDYERVIPLECPNKLVVSRKDFFKALSRVYIYSSQSSYQIKLSLSDQEVNITAQDFEYSGGMTSNKADEGISGVYTGEKMEIGFNSKFLREMIENIDSEEIILEMSQPDRAVLIFSTSNFMPEEDLLMLIMPVKLNA